MNLSFELQLFAATGMTDVTVSTGGVSYVDRVYTLGDIKMSKSFTSSSNFALFKHDSTVKDGLGTGTLTSATIGDTLTGGIAYFKSGNNSPDATAVAVGIIDKGSYTWEFNSTKLKTVVASEKSKISFLNMGDSPKLTLCASGGQSVSFDSGKTLSLKLDTAKDDLTSNAALTGTAVFKGGKGDVSLLSGSSVTGGAVSGASGEVISLSVGNSNNSVLNLKGDDAEAVVTIIGSAEVTSDNVIGFKKITYDAKNTQGNHTINLDNIKNSAVSVIGGAITDNISLGSNVKGQGSVTIDGGGGKDSITLSGAGAEIVVMESVASSGDTITGWKESAGYTEKGNAISISGGIDDFFVKDIASGTVSVGQGTLTTYSDLTEITSSDTTYGDKFGINITTKDGDTYSALLVNENELKSAANIKFDNYSYIIADGKQTLNLGNTNKKTVVLANTLDEKHWGDGNIYKNITAITSSSVGKSLIINGVDNASVSVVSAGKNDSIWGGNNGIADVISVKSGNDSNVFSGYNDGVDIVEKYEYGTDADKANAIRFLDGIGYVSAGKQNLTFGADDSNGVEVSLSGNTAGDKVAYGFGTEGEKYVAMVDATENGKGRITYGSDVNVYIGQGDNSVVKIDSTAKDVKLGWDGGAGYVSIGGVDAAMAADGAVIVGTTDNAQSIAGSSRGASSISGGFVAEEWTDDNADTLVGGGVATKTTTFFVGDKMGKDEIQNLSSKDNIVFLGSKYEDLVKFNPEATENSLTFKFSNGNTIEASVVSGRKLSNLTDVSLYFDDGTYVWNGSEFAKSE